MNPLGKNFKFGQNEFQVEGNKSKLALNKLKLSFTVKVCNTENQSDTTEKTRAISAREINNKSFLDRFIAKLPGRVTINVDNKQYSVKTASLAKKFGLTKNEVKNQEDVKDILKINAEKVLGKTVMKEKALEELQTSKLDDINTETFINLQNKYKLDKNEIINLKYRIAKKLVEGLNPKLEGNKLKEAYKNIDKKCGLNHGSTDQIVLLMNIKNIGGL